MAGFLDIDCVSYVCSCGLHKPLSQLYFCRYCSELRCAFCVCHEVDSLFCGKCCENLPSTEAKVKKNRCGNCYICPSCHQELSTKASSKQTATNPEEVKLLPKKSYYLSCLFCRWSSRDIGIPDQTAATGSWPDREHIFAIHLQSVLDMSKGIIVAEKQEKDLLKKKQRGKFVSYTDKTGITAASLRKRIGLPEDMQLLQHKNAPKKVIPAVAHEEVEDLPESIFTKPINLLEITSIEQRLLQPDSQPTEISKIFPVHKMLSIKRSLRCRHCEHNVSKPEYNPISVKFKIQLFAYFHIPEIRIVTVQPLRAGSPAELILKFTNPTQHQTVISFKAFDFNQPKSDKQDKEVSDLAEKIEFALSTDPRKLPSLNSLSSQPSSLLSLTSRQPSITIKPRPIQTQLNADVAGPENTFVLPPRDDAAEYDDFNETSTIQDDPKLVVWRKSNKAFIKLIVTPHADVNINTPITIGFTMTHLYTNTIASTVENKEPQTFNHNVKVILSLGNSVGSE